MATKKKKSKWDDVPEPSLGLEGNILYDFTVVEMQVTHTNAEPQRKMFRVEYEVDAPEEFKGRKHTEFFTIGTPDDTEADDDATLKKSFGAQAFKKMSTAAGVGMLDDDEEMAEALKDEKVSGIISERIDAKTGDKRSGVRPNNWFPVGDNEPGPTDVAAGTKAKAAKKPRKAAVEADDDEDEEPPKKKAKAAKPEADDDDDDDDDEPPPKKKAKAEADEDDDEDDEDERPPRRRK